MLRANRPRSAQTGWVSLRRLEFIDDSLAKLGYVRREYISTYFCCDLSLASMDLTAYQQAGGKIHQEIGEMQADGTVRPVGIKSGGKPYYMRDDDWHSVFNSTPARQHAWEHIAGHASNNRQWFADRRLDWLADHPGATAKDVTTYFGKGGTSTLAAYNESLSIVPERRKAWEVWLGNGR